jgi:ACS family glucarate transporter-like MFS transporter
VTLVALAGIGSTSGSSSHVRWCLVGWLFVLSAVAYLDRINISIAGTAILEEYRFTTTQLGFVFSAFLAGYALFQAPGGRLADRFGARRVLTWGVIWWGIFTALTAAVPGRKAQALLILVGVRFLLGAGEAIIYPSSSQFVAHWIPAPERGLANGIIFAGVGVGAGFTPPLINFIAAHLGWRWSFWLSALLGMAAGIVWFVAARDTPRAHPRVSRRELEWIEQGLKLPETSSAALASWRTICASREVRAMVFSYFTYGYVTWIFFAWFFIYLAKVRGLDLKASAAYSMLPFLAMTVGSLLGGRISDVVVQRWGKRLGRCGVAAMGMGLCATFVASGSRITSPRLASLVLAAGVGALYLAQSSFWSVSADVGGRSSGAVSGIMNAGGQVGGAVTALLTPVIASHWGWTASFLTAATLCAAGALAWLLVDPERPVY